MKKIFFVVFVTLSSLIFAQDGVDWKTDFEEAKKEAKSSKKPLIMYLTGSDWCSPCKRLKADFFSDEAFISQSKNVILLKVDLPFREDIITPEQRTKNQVLAKKYNKEKTFPLLIGFDSNGREIERIASYSGNDTSYHFNFFKKILRY